MATRSIWKGNISFGLVNIPVQVFSAVQNEDHTTFDQLCKKGHKIKYKRWCPVEEREVPWSEIRKGYEITKNSYLVLEKEDIDMIKLKSTRTIEINEFIELKDFDPIFVEKSYYIGPDVGKKKVESTANAYSLFVKVLLLVLLNLSVIPQTFFTFSHTYAQVLNSATINTSDILFTPAFPSLATERPFVLGESENVNASSGGGNVILLSQRYDEKEFSNEIVGEVENNGTEP